MTEYIDIALSDLVLVFQDFRDYGFLKMRPMQMSVVNNFYFLE